MALGSPNYVYLYMKPKIGIGSHGYNKTIWISENRIYYSAWIRICSGVSRQNEIETYFGGPLHIVDNLINPISELRVRRRPEPDSILNRFK